MLVASPTAKPNGSSSRYRSILECDQDSRSIVLLPKHRKDYTMLDIITNHHRRPLIYHWELTAKELENFEYTTEESLFFRCRGELYTLDNFMRIENHPNSEFSSWDGYSSDSFFSGILVKYPREDWGEFDHDHIIVATYIA